MAAFLLHSSSLQFTLFRHVRVDACVLMHRSGFEDNMKMDVATTVPRLSTMALRICEKDKPSGENCDAWEASFDLPKRIESSPDNSQQQQPQPEVKWDAMPQTSANESERQLEMDDKLFQTLVDKMISLKTADNMDWRQRRDAVNSLMMEMARLMGEDIDGGGDDGDDDGMDMQM